MVEHSPKILASKEKATTTTTSNTKPLVYSRHVWRQPDVSCEVCSVSVDQQQYRECEYVLTNIVIVSFGQILPNLFFLKRMFIIAWAVFFGKLRNWTIT